MIVETKGKPGRKPKEKSFYEECLKKSNYSKAIKEFYFKYGWEYRTFDHNFRSKTPKIW